MPTAFFQRDAHALGDGIGFQCGNPRQNDEKLFATVSAEEVIVAQLPFDIVRNGPNDLGTDTVTIEVVETLEVVNVGHDAA